MKNRGKSRTENIGQKPIYCTTLRCNRPQLPFNHFEVRLKGDDRYYWNNKKYKPPEKSYVIKVFTPLEKCKFGCLDLALFICRKMAPQKSLKKMQGCSVFRPANWFKHVFSIFFLHKRKKAEKAQKIKKIFTKRGLPAIINLACSSFTQTGDQ